MDQRTRGNNRILVAIVGALLVGVISAAIAGIGTFRSTIQHAQTGGGATASSSVPSATKTSSVQRLMETGIIQQVDSHRGAFSLLKNPATLQTVVVTSDTLFQGEAQTIADLEAGMQVTVTGLLQSDGTLHAQAILVPDS